MPYEVSSTMHQRKECNCTDRVGMRLFGVACPAPHSNMHRGTLRFFKLSAYFHLADSRNLRIPFFLLSFFLLFSVYARESNKDDY